MTWVGFALLSLAAFPTTPVLVLLALPFARMSPTNVFPPWLQWLNTPDDVAQNQGLYEPAVYAWFILPTVVGQWLIEHMPSWISVPPTPPTTKLQAVGWYFKTWYWLGLRNQMLGLFALLSAKYDGTPVTESTWWKLKIYSIPGYKEITWPGRRVSFGYKVQTLKTAKVGATIWWVFMPAFWLARSY